VLAGIEPPRKWAAPVRLTDVIRAALGEVEDYQRVTVRGVEPATILGSAAADLAHLLAELIENALVFSPPDQTVDIRGRNRPQGYTLAIIDSGLGMPDTDITAANRRLAGAESFTIAPSKYLGHYVAGNLAARHNIHVHLDNSPGTGITATIDIPTTLLTTDTDLADPITPPHGHRALPTTTPDTNGGGDRSDWSILTSPAAAAPAAPVAPPDPGPLPVPSEISRTQSGLVKRAARPGGGTTVGAGQPSGELLDSLRRHTANLQVHTQEGDTAPAAPAGQQPAWDRAHAAQPPAQPPTAGPAWGDPPVAGPAWGDPPAQPPAAWDRPPAGPQPQPPQPPQPQPQPQPQGWQQPLPRRTEQPQQAAPRPPSAPAAPRPPADAEAAGGATTSGLARRVRGAQLPTAEPVRLRRGGGSPAAPPARTGGRPSSQPSRPPRRDDRPRSADDVYSFLSSFSAGVRRGLDESSSRPPQPGGPAAPGW
jgi:hypothetical protein